MLVKCLDLNGEKMPKEECWRDPKGRYWSSKKAWERKQSQLLYRSKCIDLFRELLAYMPSVPLPTYVYKLLGTLEGYGYDVVYQTFVDKSKDIQWALDNKQFNNEYGKVKYVFSIVQNSINYVYKRMQKEKTRVAMIPEVTEENIELKQRQQETKDISRFLLED